MFNTLPSQTDFRYILETAQAGNAEMPVSARTGEVYRQAIAAEYGSDNITRVIQLFT